MPSSETVHVGHSGIYRRRDRTRPYRFLFLLNCVGWYDLSPEVANVSMCSTHMLIFNLSPM